MKKITSITITFFCTVLSLSAQLKWINPKPAGGINNKIKFADSFIGFILNNNGDLIKTPDQGQTWKLIRHFSNMVSFDVKDSTVIIAGYGSTIYTSTNLGVTWNAVDVTNVNSPGFNNVEITSRDTIFLSTGTSLHRSTDGGKNWQIITIPAAAGISCIDFVNGQVGFVGLKERAILKTTNSGTTWQETAVVNYTPSGVLAMKFLNKDTGYAFRQSGALLNTTDGGLNWTSTTIPFVVNAIDFPSQSVGYFAGAFGATYLSTDAGASWNPSGVFNQLYDGFNLLSLCFINTDTGFAVGERGRILKTVDRGVNWSSYSTFYTQVTDFAFPDAATGYAVSGNILYKTTDSSTSWQALPYSSTLGSNNAFDKVYFFSKDTGMVTSTNPAKVHTTTDGGVTWENVNPTGYYGYDQTADVNFINKSTGFICNTTDNGYHISKTTDRGKTWQNLDSNLYYGQVFYKIHFINEKAGFASRYSQLFKTNDSAKTWMLVKDNDSYHINCLWFHDEATGFYGDDYGLKKTIDSGKTWTTINLVYEDREIIDIRFPSSSIGYLTSSSGSIYQSSDSGNSWVLFAKAVRGVYKIQHNSSNVYFAGPSGAILSSTAKYVIGSEYVCSGSTISFSSNIIGSTYSWGVSSDGGASYTPLTDGLLFTGTKTPIINIVTNGTFVNKLFRCVVDGNKNSRQFQFKFQARWTGAADNSWENPLNWSCNNVPLLTDDVLIGNGDIFIHSDVKVHLLTILPGASISVDPGFHLTITQ